MSTGNLSISVIIPLYNGARFITHALDSVFAQSIKPIEVIVIDDGSTDEGPAIVARYAAQQPLRHLHKPNGGQSSARNFGIRHAQGTLIALLDQDDAWYPHHLRELSRPFQEDNTATLGWTYSNLDEITEDNRLRIRSLLSGGSAEHPKTDLEKCLGEDMFILPSASMISRSAFDAVGGFDENLIGYEDDDLFVRLFVAGYKNVYINEPLGRWRMNSTSSSYTPRMAKSRMLYARKLLRCFPDQPVFNRYYARDLIAPRFLRQVVEETRKALRAGDAQAIEACLQDIAFLEAHISPEPKPYPLREELLITAVIPLYNGARFIREAIQSVIGQTLLPDELIVVDDGSTDDGPDIVTEMARHHPIRLVRKPNGGQSSARNVGVDHAHGDLIAFLDQDDAWYPNHLATLVKPFHETRGIELGWTYSELDKISETGEIITRGYLGTLATTHPKRELRFCLKEDMFILPSASLISRKAFLSVGGFDERLSGYEDDDLFLRLFQAGFDNTYIPQALSKWRIYKSSTSYSPRMAVSRAIYARTLIQRFSDDHDMENYFVRDFIAPRFFRDMVSELRKAVLKGRKDQQKAAFDNLAFITGHLSTIRRVPLQFLFLPALRVPPFARFIMRYRILLFASLRGLFRHRG
ncbi:glycosyltransferase family 2 protein [Rhodopila sp.]|uniref:glycosyltransferase family 2 protein n=1 Tax=Rhodopila sp. TaxID=2480087 RepID=UPI003D13974A